METTTKLLFAMGVSLPTVVQAGWWEDIDISLDGFVRPEIAIRTTSGENPYNQRGNIFNGQPVERTSFTTTDTVTRGLPQADNEFNLTILRGKAALNARLTGNLRFIAEVRGIYDIDEYDNYTLDDAPGTNPAGTLQRRPNLFEYRVSSDGGALQAREAPMALELTGRDYMVDLPKFFLDYNVGSLNLRVGNQQIAWGQSLFFRVLDVPNGLDLRRHSLLDYVPEEFSDKRVPSPAIRASYMLGSWELDGFVQHFRPTIYSNPNTPYNAIASQFTVHDLYGEVDDEVNYGLRVRGPLGPFNLQLMAARRYAPDGTFRWTQSGVDRSLTGAPGDMTGPLMAQTAFERDPTGVVSAQEWFHYAGLSRLDAIDGLNASINEFPAAQMLGAAPVQDEMGARLTLDTFFQASGGLRGHIAREYHRENVFGAGLSYVFRGEAGSIFDQLITNIEVQYAQDRTFTNVSLSRDYIVEDEWTAALVFEKYQKFSYQFPATYFVLQWLHKSESDLFGRKLEGMGGSAERAARDASDPSNANYVAFAFQQPFPNLIWRVDFAALYDVEGGLLLQPAVRWTLSREFSMELFYNYLEGDLGSKNPNYNAISTVDYADELGIRAT
ncbi:DUF1302 family protein [Spectribacter hydrogenooxidans]|uniref:DUF1302 family protein n=1 Tax=Spectribacter hydrogenoxidans TaxID=3075608 RepID=A0ABU3BWR7_9GAMM|nr:DUF1302 family protein [Salinisphaera sp. W335]MDT0633746.1 DUF1302 family protein [Salinisphaera sp. W335]